MILLVGPSASGKTEVTKALAAKYGMSKAITHTTRQPRVGERNGVDYFFVSDSEFEALEEKGFFVETTFYNGHQYGCGKDQLGDDKCIAVDPNGLIHFTALGNKRLVVFYLSASDKTRAERMKGRGDSAANIESRLKNDENDFNGVPEGGRIDYLINTEGLTVSQIADQIRTLYEMRLAK